MELVQLKCFIAVAEELHFGNAAHKLNMLPSALGRYVKLLEDGLGTRLLTRSTRNVKLTPQGELFLIEAKILLTKAEDLQRRFQHLARERSHSLRIGAIDSASVGLIPYIFQRFRKKYPHIELQFVEDRTSKLLPKLRAGHLDLIFSRTLSEEKLLEKRPLFYEKVGLVVSELHPLSQKTEIFAEDLVNIPLIVPERKIRPHSYDITISLFEETEIKPKLVQIADEKLTILNMVAANLGVAIMPQWVGKLSSLKVKSIPISDKYVKLHHKLPISACWLREYPDEMRDNLIRLVEENTLEINALY